MDKERMEQLLLLVKDDMRGLGYPIDNDKVRAVIVAKGQAEYPEETAFMVGIIDRYAKAQEMSAPYEPIEALQYDYDCFRIAVLNDSVCFKHSQASLGELL